LPPVAAAAAAQRSASKEIKLDVELNKLKVSDSAMHITIFHFITNSLLHHKIDRKR